MVGLHNMHMHETYRALIVQRHGERHGPPFVNAVGERGQAVGYEGSAGVSVARDGRMIALPQQRHEVAPRLGELAQGLSNSKKVTKK
jgi:hypothetical protein